MTAMYFFSLNFIYFQQKESVKVQSWWSFMWAVEGLKFCNVMGFFVQIMYILATEKLSLMTLKSDTKFE